MRLLSACDLDWQPRPPPLRKAHVQSPRLQTATAEQPHGVVGVDAVGAAAVGDNLTPLGQLADDRSEHVDGDGTRACDMTGAKLGLGAHIEYDHITTLEPP